MSEAKSYKKQEVSEDDSERGSVWFVGRENGMEVVFEES